MHFRLLEKNTAVSSLGAFILRAFKALVETAELLTMIIMCPFSGLGMGSFRIEGVSYLSLVSRIKNCAREAIVSYIKRKKQARKQEGRKERGREGRKEERRRKRRQRTKHWKTAILLIKG